MTDQQSRQALDEALTHAALGHKIVPVPHMEKYPKGIGKWQEKGAPNEKQVYEWWGESTNGIGWVMGLQPNGTFLIAIDVDVANGKQGAENIKDLWNSYQIKPAFSATIQAITGSGGRHFIFKAPPGCGIGNPRLGEALDTRGNGGFIVISPSIHPNGQRYQWVEGHAPWECDPVLIPGVILDMLKRADEPKPQPVAPTLRRAPSEFNDDPKQWVKDQFTCLDFLEGLGWQSAGKNAWTRPGKSVRDGSSAEYHPDDDVFNVFSTTDMHLYEQFGYRGNGCITLNAFDLWAITYKHATVSSAMSAIRKAMPKPSAPDTVLGGLPSEEPITGHTEGSTASHALNLPPEFWDARPVLSHIRQAAWSRMESPDAVLGTMLARYAAAIPVTYRIPAIVGAPATFDHLSVLVGESSGGKSVAMSIARELFSGPQFSTIVWDLPVPTGEGLISSFFEELTEDDGSGKKKIVNKKTKDAVHFSIDEGMSLIQAGAQRQGTTIASVLCSAWTGQNPGQANASKERRRVDLMPFTFRVSGVMGIQFALGHHLLAENWVDQGLSGRLLFFSTEDTSIPFDTPEWPGPIKLPIHPTSPVELEYAPTIHSEVRVAHHAKKTRRTHEAPIDGHLRLVRLKVSGVFALMDARTTVTDEDWDLAGIVVASSVAIRNAMKSVAAEANHRANVTKATAAGTYESVRESAKDQADMERCVKQVLARLDGKSEGMSRKDLRASLSSTAVRQMIDVALEVLRGSGQVSESDGIWKTGR